MSAATFTPGWYCTLCGCSGEHGNESGNGCTCPICHPENQPPVDYRYTRCGDCWGTGHDCPTCHGHRHEPERALAEAADRIHILWAQAADKRKPAPARQRRLRRRGGAR